VFYTHLALLWHTCQVMCYFRSMALRTKLLPSVPRFQVDNFGYYRRSFCAEISSLGRMPWSQLYDDAIDEGLILENPKTGREVAFVLSNVKHDREGEILQWEFIPLGELVRQNPQLCGVTLMIFND
jgi:hypothetical protein